MKLECPHCGKEFDGAISKDALGWHTACPDCTGSFDIGVPKGRYVMAFALDDTDEFFTDDWFDDNSIVTYYAFDTPEELVAAWYRKSVDPDSMWYWLLDDGKCFCSGACDPGDIDIIEKHFGRTFEDTRTPAEMVPEWFPMTVVAHFKLTREDIDDIMVGALEGGINYWCQEAEVVEADRVADWGHEQIARGGYLRLHDIEDYDEVNVLTLEKFLAGFKKWFEEGHDEYGAVDLNTGEVDCCQIDASCADEIIQFALFGKLVFC